MAISQRAGWNMGGALGQLVTGVLQSRQQQAEAQKLAQEGDTRAAFDTEYAKFLRSLPAETDPNQFEAGVLELADRTGITVGPVVQKRIDQFRDDWRWKQEKIPKPREVRTPEQSKALADVVAAPFENVQQGMIDRPGPSVGTGEGSFIPLQDIRARGGEFDAAGGLGDQARASAGLSDLVTRDVVAMGQSRLEDFQKRQEGRLTDEQKRMDAAQKDLDRQEAFDLASKATSPDKARRILLAFGFSAEESKAAFPEPVGRDGFQKIPSDLVQNEDGTYSYLTPVFNPSTGGVSVVQTPVGKGARFANELGQTPQAKSQLDIATAGGKKVAELTAEGKLAPPVEQAKEQAKALGKASAESANKAVEGISKIKANIRTLDKVVKLIDEGAKTGVIEKRLPSFRAASIELDQVRNQLGLDVVGSVTFGALSEGELKLALDTALPSGLAPKALRKWALEKKSAQEKLANYMEEQAVFLSKSGNTQADWMESQKTKSGMEPSKNIVEVDF
jgi:hypothetical protein